MHEHDWAFIFRSNGYEAHCACGLDVIVEMGPDGRQTGIVRWQGQVPPPAMAADLLESLQRARRTWRRTHSSRN